MKVSRETTAWPKNLLSRKAFSVLLAVAGATMVTAGVWMIFAPAGWIVGGCLVLAFDHKVDMDMSQGEEGRAG